MPVLLHPHHQHAAAAAAVAAAAGCLLAAVGQPQAIPLLQQQQRPDYA
jgi:hypothetical protein